MTEQQPTEYRNRVARIEGDGRPVTRIARQYDAYASVRLASSYDAPDIAVTVDRWGRYRVTITAVGPNGHERTAIASGDLAEYWGRRP